MHQYKFKELFFVVEVNFNVHFGLFQQQNSSGEDACMVDSGVSSSADNGNLGRPFNASADNLRYIDEGSDDFTLERLNSIKETGL